MSNPWYRAWVGLVSDPKIGEAALIADVSVSLVIAVWHALLESASEVDDGAVAVAKPTPVSRFIDAA